MKQWCCPFEGCKAWAKSKDGLYAHVWRSHLKHDIARLLVDTFHQLKILRVLGD